MGIKIFIANITNSIKLCACQMLYVCCLLLHYDSDIVLWGICLLGSSFRI
jgi:hypothetical protein